MLKTIIINELNKRLGRESTAAEQQEAYLDISDNFMDTDTFTDLIAGMNDYVNNNYRACSCCGRMYKFDELTEVSGPFGYFQVCSNPDCEQTAYYDAHYDRTREWATY